jgi:hypothetical protein
VTSRLTHAAVFLVAATLLAGCRGGDGQSAAAKAAMNKKFADLDYTISNVTLSQPPYPEHLEPLVEQYVATIRKYAGDLGDDEVNRRLAQKAAELEPFCLPCVGVLDREREHY